MIFRLRWLAKERKYRLESTIHGMKLKTRGSRADVIRVIESLINNDYNDIQEKARVRREKEKPS